MPTVRAALLEILGALGALKQRFALVSGLAVSARTERRTTCDVDIAVAAADDVGAEALIFALQQRGYSVVTVIEQQVLCRLATERLLPPGGGSAGALVDLLFASTGIAPEMVAAAEPLEVVRHVHAPVATTDHLLAMKVLARDDSAHGIGARSYSSSQQRKPEKRRAVRRSTA